MPAVEFLAWLDFERVSSFCKRLINEKMISFENGETKTSRVISADTALVWNIVIDTMLWPEWGPSVSVVECDDRYINGRSRGRLKTAFGLWVPFTVTEFEEGHFWSWRIGRIEATGHRVTRYGNHQSLLSFSMPWWSTPYVIICNRALNLIENLATSPQSTGQR